MFVNSLACVPLPACRPPPPPPWPPGTSSAWGHDDKTHTWHSKGKHLRKILSNFFENCEFDHSRCFP